VLVSPMRIAYPIEDYALIASQLVSFGSTSNPTLEILW